MATIIYPNSQSTLTLGGYTFTNLAEGEAMVLAPVNELSSRTNSQGGGVSVSKRIDSGVHTLTVNVQRHSPDYDQCEAWRKASTIAVLDGSLKRSYTQDGTSKKETRALSSASMTTQQTDTQNNQDGNNIATYVFECRNAD